MCFLGEMQLVTMKAASLKWILRRLTLMANGTVKVTDTEQNQLSIHGKGRGRFWATDWPFRQRQPLPKVKLFLFMVKAGS